LIFGHGSKPIVPLKSDYLLFVVLQNLVDGLLNLNKRGFHYPKVCKDFLVKGKNTADYFWINPFCFENYLD